MGITVASTPSSPLPFIPNPTPQLLAAVAQLQATLSSDDFAKLLSEMHTAFGQHTADLLQYQPGTPRGEALHRMIDRETAGVARNAIAVSCRKGCTGCCHYEVEITGDEAAVLKKAMATRGITIALDRLALQAARERQSPAWHRFGSLDNRCVFLDETGACRLYEDRPSICRKHMVTSPAEACTTPDTQVSVVRVLLAEILLSAALSLEGTSYGSLPKMLQTALRA